MIGAWGRMKCVAWTRDAHVVVKRRVLITMWSRSALRSVRRASSIKNACRRCFVDSPWAQTNSLRREKSSDPRGANGESQRSRRTPKSRYARLNDILHAPPQKIPSSHPHRRYFPILLLTKSTRKIRAGLFISITEVGIAQAEIRQVRTETHG